MTTTILRDALTALLNALDTEYIENDRVSSARTNARAALATADADQAPDARYIEAEYQYRMRPEWREDGEGWQAWVTCSPEAYADYRRAPSLHDWQYQTRILYLREPATGGPVAARPAPVGAVPAPACALRGGKCSCPTACMQNMAAANPLFAASSLTSASSDHAFKNFHSNLCKRFGYVHDELDWRRDLVSLEEYIANLIDARQPFAAAPAAPNENCRLRLCCRDDAHAADCTTYDPARKVDEYAAPAAPIGADTATDWQSMQPLIGRGKRVVQRLYNDTPNVADSVEAGDVIQSLTNYVVHTLHPHNNPAAEHAKPEPVEQAMPDEEIIAAWDAQRKYHGGEPCKLGHMEFAYAILAKSATAGQQAGAVDGEARYEFVRTLHPHEFANLWRENMNGGGKFDDLVDREREARAVSANQKGGG